MNGPRIKNRVAIRHQGPGQWTRIEEGKRNKWEQRRKQILQGPHKPCSQAVQGKPGPGGACRSEWGCQWWRGTGHCRWAGQETVLGWKHGTCENILPTTSLSPQCLPQSRRSVRWHCYTLSNFPKARAFFWQDNSEKCSLPCTWPCHLNSGMDSLPWDRPFHCRAAPAVRRTSCTFLFPVMCTGES